MTYIRVQHFLQDCMCAERRLGSEPSQGTLWVVEDPRRLQMDNKDAYRSVRMRRLICVFAVRTCNSVGNAVPRLQ